MMRNVVFVSPQGSAVGRTEAGEAIVVPLIPGLLKHLSLEELRPLLQEPEVLSKYTREALRWAPWPCLREFPFDWLRNCLEGGWLREGRARAIRYLLDAAEQRGERR